MEKYVEDNSDRELSQAELANLRWTKYKIVVPTEQDKKDLEEAFEHLHYTDCNTNNVPVNQLIHEYLTEEVTGDPKTKNNIIVNKKLYKELQDG